MRRKSSVGQAAASASNFCSSTARPQIDELAVCKLQFSAWPGTVVPFGALPAVVAAGVVRRQIHRAIRQSCTDK